MKATLGGCAQRVLIAQIISMPEGRIGRPESVKLRSQSGCCDHPRPVAFMATALLRREFWR